jgi:hypothetical protein
MTTNAIMTRDPNPVVLIAGENREILKRALMMIQDQIANRKAEVANCDAEIARLKALEISLQNVIRMADHESQVTSHGI